MIAKDYRSKDIYYHPRAMMVFRQTLLSSTKTTVDKVLLSDHKLLDLSKIISLIVLLIRVIER